MAGRPSIIAARGDVEEAPENTLPAFESAIARGADGVELDVHFFVDRLHRDGLLVHGSNLDSAEQIRHGLALGIDQFSTGRLGLALRVRDAWCLAGDAATDLAGFAFGKGSTS